MPITIGSHRAFAESGTIGQTNASYDRHNIRPSTPPQTSQSMQGSDTGSNIWNARPLNARPVQLTVNTVTNFIPGQPQTKDDQSSSFSADPAASSPTGDGASQGTPISSSSTLSESSAAVSPQLAPAQPPASQTAPSPTPSASPASSAASSPTGTGASPASQGTQVLSSDTSAELSSSVPPPPAQPPASQTAPSPIPSAPPPAPSNPAAPLPNGNGIPPAQTKVGSGFLELSGSDKTAYNELREKLISLVGNPIAKIKFKKLLTVKEESSLLYFELHYNKPISKTLQKAILEDIIPSLATSQKQLALHLAFLCNYSNSKKLQDEIPEEDIRNLPVQYIKKISNPILKSAVAGIFEPQNEFLLNEKFPRLPQTCIFLPKGVTIGDNADSITIKDFATKVQATILSTQTLNAVSLQKEHKNELPGNRYRSLILNNFQEEEDDKLHRKYENLEIICERLAKGIKLSEKEIKSIEEEEDKELLRICHQSTISEKDKEILQTKLNHFSTQKNHLRSKRNANPNKEAAKLLAIHFLMSHDATDLILHLAMCGKNIYSDQTMSPQLTENGLKNLENGNWFLSSSKGVQEAITALFKEIDKPNSTADTISEKFQELSDLVNYQKSDSTNSLGGFSIAKPNTAADPEPTPVPTSTSGNAGKNLIRKIKAKIHRRSSTTTPSVPTSK